VIAGFVLLLLYYTDMQQKRNNFEKLISHIREKPKQSAMSGKENLSQLCSKSEAILKEELIKMQTKMPKKDDRLYLAPLGEQYEDLLAIDAFLAGNSIPQQGKSSLSAYLKQKKPYIEEGVKYLARKRGITFEEMWDLILTGQTEKLSSEEYKELLESKD
jgi:hypothetical protein